jgi:hypothetical protein
MNLAFICPSAVPTQNDFYYLRLLQSFQRYTTHRITLTTSLANVDWQPDTVVFYDRFIVARCGSEQEIAFFDRERELLAQRKEQVRGRVIVAATGDGAYGWMIRTPDLLLQEVAVCLFYHSKRKDFDTSRWPWLAEHCFAIQGPPVYRLNARPSTPFKARAKAVYWLGTPSGIWSTESNDRLIAMQRLQSVPHTYTMVLGPAMRVSKQPLFISLRDAFMALNPKVLYEPVDKVAYLGEVSRYYFLLGSYGNAELSVRYVDAAATGTVLLSPNLENMDLIGDWKAGVNYYDLGVDGMSRLPDFIEDFRTKPDSYWEDMGRNCAALYDRFYAVGQDEAHTPETFNEFMRRINAITPILNGHA